MIMFKTKAVMTIIRYFHNMIISKFVLKSTAAGRVLGWGLERPRHKEFAYAVEKWGANG